MSPIVIALAFVLFASPASAVPVPGTSVDVSPPEGFTKSDRFPGFMDEATSSSIMITEIPGPHVETTSGFNDQKRMQTQGMKLLNKSSVKVDGQPAILLDIEQSAYGTMFKKWVLAVDRTGSTTLITATYPSAELNRQEKKLKEAILGATFGKKTDPKEALSFAATPSPPFEIAKVMGQSMILSVNGEFPVKDKNLPFMVLALSPTKGVVISDKKAFAENVVMQTATVKNITIERNTPVKIGTLIGYSTIAEGKSEDATTLLTIYQVVLFDASGYSVILGATPSAKRETYFPVFEKIAKSFALKTSHN